MLFLGILRTFARHSNCSKKKYGGNIVYKWISFRYLTNISLLPQFSNSTLHIFDNFRRRTEPHISCQGSVDNKMRLSRFS